MMSARPHRESPPNLFVADLHVHPSLKTALFDYRFGKRYRTSRHMIPFTMRTSLPRLLEGGIRLIFSSVYVPEKGLFRDCRPLVPPALLFSSVRRALRRPPDEQAEEVIKRFEADCRVAADRTGGNVRIVRTLEDLHEIRNDSALGIVHALEGAHVLNGRLENLEKFYGLGVRLVTLAHFYENEAVSPVPGVPPQLWIRKIGCFRERKDLSRGLTPFGRELVEKMMELGMIIDLTHATPKARTEIFDIVGKKAPLVFSHVGCSALLEDPMNPTDEEIRRVAETGGLIGVLFMKEWLVPAGAPVGGLEAVLRTIRHIVNVGGIDSVAIGSDLDGFTHPIGEIKDASEFPRLHQALMENGYSEGEIRRILGANVLRILESLL